MLEHQNIKPGDILISSPYTETSLVFSKAVILITSHDENNTSGIMINKILNNIDISTILKSFNIEKANNPDISINLSVYFGGPVEQEKGALLHSSDYKGSKAITTKISLSIDPQVFRDISLDLGPHYKMLTLGYSSWAAGQLVDEIKRNYWLVLPNITNDYMELIFSNDNSHKWSKALKLLGINLSDFSSSFGQA